jgi:hypothetical protein
VAAPGAECPQLDPHAPVSLDPDDPCPRGKPDRLAAFRPGVQVRVPAPPFAVGADRGHDEVHDIGLRPKPASHGLPPPMARRIASSAIRVAEHGCWVSAALHPAQMSLPGKGKCFARIRSIRPGSSARNSTAAATAEVPLFRLSSDIVSFFPVDVR